MALIGVAVVVAQGEPARLMDLRVATGDGLMLAANLAWALYNVLARRYMPKDAPLGSTALVMAAGAIVLLAVALWTGTVPALPGPRASLALAVMAMAGTVLAYLFWGLGLARLGAGRTALFLNLVPVFAMLIGGALGEPPTAAQFAGGALVLAGVTLAMAPMRVPAAR